MRYVIMFKSSLRFLRCDADQSRIAEFETYEAAEGRASQLGSDSCVLEIGRRRHA